MGYSSALTIFTANASYSFSKEGGKNSKEAEGRLIFAKIDITHLKKNYIKN